MGTGGVLRGAEGEKEPTNKEGVSGCEDTAGTHGQPNEAAWRLCAPRLCPQGITRPA